MVQHTCESMKILVQTHTGNSNQMATSGKRATAQLVSVTDTLESESTSDQVYTLIGCSMSHDAERSYD
jgi:hypothetical protein